MDTGLLLIAGGALAGGFGALLGLGGGILIIPFLTLVFEMPLREAVGVSLVSVIVTSGAATAVYLERRVADLRLGMRLELFTAAGAFVGAFVAFLVDERFLAGLFAGLLVYTSISMVRAGRRAAVATTNGGPAVDDGDGTASEADRPLRNRGLGAGASLGAGVISAMLGVGGGVIMVPVMHVAMGVPLRVAAATSTMMIGVTASAAAIVYLARDGIDPYVVGPVALGVFAGATAASRLSHRVDVRTLRLLFVAVLLYSAVMMLRRALGVA